MAKKSIRYRRLILTGIIWIPLYMDTIDRIFYGLFDFRSLAWEDWAGRFAAFQKGEWIISSGADWALFLGMLLYIPLLLLGWYWVYRFKWSRLVPRALKEKKVKKQTLQIASVKKMFEPARLRVQSSALLSVPVGAEQPHATPSAPTTPVNIPNIPDPGVQSAMPSQSVYEDEEEVQRILAMTSGIKADFFPHVTLDGAYASFALSTEKQAAVIRIINQPDSVWAVDTEVDIAQSDWFEQSAILPTPARDVMAIAENLRDNEPDSMAVPIILLMSGKLLNAAETMAYFEKNNVMLLRMEEAEADEVPLFLDFLSQYFENKNEGEIAG